MKTFFESFAAAFSMYSKIPMPQFTWNEKNMRYSFLFFPLVGVVIAFALYILLFLSYHFQFSTVFFASAAILLTVLITGGLHLDGYCDTIDALSSHKEKEDKLNILKDPHVGAFAVIYTVTILLLQFGAWHQVFLTQSLIPLVLISFILSRSLAALAVVTFPCAKSTGLASIFADLASQRTVRFLLGVYIFLCAAAMLYVNLIAGIITLIVVSLTYLWFYFMTRKHFGGMTGDLAGFYIVICETGVLLTAAITGGLIR